MKMSLGLSSFAYYWASRIQPYWIVEGMPMTPGRLLARTAELGLQVLQICENMPLTHCRPDELRGLREAAERLGVALEVGTRGLDLDSLRANLGITRELGGRILRISPWPGSETRSAITVEQLGNVVRELLPLCRESDITLGIENYFDIPDHELAAMMRELDDPHVGICLDTANSAGNLQEPMDTAELLAPYAVSVHLKDFVVTKPTMGYVISGVPLGTGWVDARHILDRVSHAGRRPNVLLELWVDHVGADEDTLKREDEWVRQSIAYARDRLGFRVGRTTETSPNTKGT